MGHDHHFLSRLDRVAPAQVDFALSLYRDAEFVRYVLAHAHIPDGAARVAISVDDPNEGPFIVVARDGGFVTCLGRGMSPAPNLVLTRERIDGMAARFEDFRARLGAARAWEAAEGGLDRLIRRIHVAGSDLSREQFLALSALQPVLQYRFAASYFAALSDVNASRAAALKIERPRPREQEFLHTYFNQFYAAQHLALLTAMNGGAFLDVLPPDALEEVCKGFSWGLVRQGLSAPALRGAWGVARIGKVMVVPCKRRYASSNTVLTTIDAGYGLLMLALRHTRLRAEIVKALSSERAATIHGDEISPLVPHLRKYFGKMAELLAENPEVLREPFLEASRNIWMRLQGALPEGSRFRFANARDVPDSLAQACVTYPNVDIANKLESLTDQVLCFPQVARMQAEDFYLPGEVLSELKTPWEPEHTMTLLKPLRAHYGKTAPVRVAEQPGRNDPCPCNSGRKYKKCCGAANAGGAPTSESP